MGVTFKKVLKAIFIFIAFRLVSCFGMFKSFFQLTRTAGDYLGDAFDGVDKVLRGITTVEQIFSDAVQEDCIFTCGPGLVMKDNPRHEPQSDGCGSFGLKIYGLGELLPTTSLTNCCHAHDTCYDTCGRLKEDCDTAFKTCLYEICNANNEKLGNSLFKACQAASKMMYTGTLAIGCKAFKDAQFNACNCEKPVPEKPSSQAPPNCPHKENPSQQSEPTKCPKKPKHKEQNQQSNKKQDKHNKEYYKKEL